VLCGDMSLIGPRPILRRDMPTDENILNERYSVKPGITGWAQVNGGRMISNSSRHRLDIFYIRNASFVLDIKISFMTVKTMMFGETVDDKVLERANKLKLSEP
ncbi:MAG: sugar transferase, partial [Geminicoccaceae bacterium]